MSQSKILFLLHLPPPVHGSSMVGQWIMDSQKISTRFETSFINLLVSKSIHETGRFSISKVFSAIGIVRQVWKQCRSTNYELTYYALTSSGLAFYRDFIVVSLLKVLNIPVVFHLHNKGIEKKSNSKLHRYLYKKTFSNTDVILLSQHLYFDVKRFVPIENVFICPNGIPKVDYIENGENSKETENVTLLFLSNLIESKGILTLLEAMPIIVKEFPNIKLNIVGGEGDILIENLKILISKLKIEKNVKYLGKKYGQEKYDILSTSDIFVFPTYYELECFPLVLLEAMQFRLPIITTNEGGILDIVEHKSNGFIIEKQNPKALASAVLELVKNKELRREMGEISQKLFLKKFTLCYFEENLSTILEKIIKKNDQNVR